MYYMLANELHIFHIHTFEFLHHSQTFAFPWPAFAVPSYTPAKRMPHRPQATTKVYAIFICMDIFMYT